MHFSQQRISSGCLVWHKSNTSRGYGTKVSSYSHWSPRYRRSNSNCTLHPKPFGTLDPIHMPNGIERSPLQHPSPSSRQQLASCARPGIGEHGLKLLGNEQLARNWGLYTFSTTNATKGSRAIPTPLGKFFLYLGIPKSLTKGIYEISGPFIGFVDVGWSNPMVIGGHVDVCFVIASPAKNMCLTLTLHFVLLHGTLSNTL